MIIRFISLAIYLALVWGSYNQALAQSNPKKSNHPALEQLENQVRSEDHHSLLVPSEYNEIESTSKTRQSTVPAGSMNKLETDRLQEKQTTASVKKDKVSSLSKIEVKLAFDRGRNSYLYGSYKDTVKNLRPLLYPKVLIAQPESLSLSYEYLALAYFYLGEQELAIQTFKDLIYARPEHQLDPVRVPPNAVSLYNQLHDELQSELQQRQEALERQTELEKEREQQSLKQSVILEQQVNQRLVAFLPFGAGQFQNRNPELGYFFLGSELVAVGLSAGFFWGVESMREIDGRFSRQNYPIAQSLQRAQIISGGIALGLMVSGVIQALWRYQDRYNLGNYLDLDSEAESVDEQEAVTEDDLPFVKNQADH